VSQIKLHFKIPMCRPKLKRVLNASACRQHNIDLYTRPMQKWLTSIASVASVVSCCCWT